MEQISNNIRKWITKKKYKICCPKCGHRVLRGNVFDIDLSCRECGTQMDVKIEGNTVFMIFELKACEE